MRRKMLAMVGALVIVVDSSRDRLPAGTGDGWWMLVRKRGNPCCGVWFGSDWRSRRCRIAVVATEN